MSFSVSPGQAGDAPEGRDLLQRTKLSAKYVIMDRAYEGDETRHLVEHLGMTPVVPPKSNRREPWDYDRGLYKKRNEVERLFRDARLGPFSPISNEMVKNFLGERMGLPKSY